MDLTERLVSTVLAMFGLDYEGAPRRIDRLAFYRARVDAVASDGSTVDVTPESNRLSPMQRVPLRVGIPGAVAIMQPGAVVLLGWERGDAERLYAQPAWESGATVVKLVVNAQALYLGGESGTEALVRKSDFDGHTHAAGTLAAPPGGGAVTGATAGAAAATGTSITRAK